MSIVPSPLKSARALPPKEGVEVVWLNWTGPWTPLIGRAFTGTVRVAEALGENDAFPTKNARRE